MKTNVYYLPNGLPVIYIVNQASVLSYACLCVNAGAKDEPLPLLGLAHAIEHFLFLGSKHHSKQEINCLPSQLGSEIDAFTEIDFTTFDFCVLPKYFPDMLKLLADILIYPQFPEEGISKELEIIKTEMSSREDDDDDRRIGYNLHTCFGMNKKKAHIYGTEKTISRISAEKARAFWEQYYVAANSVLCVYVNNDSYRPLIDEYFGKMSKGCKMKTPEIPFQSSTYKVRGYASEAEISLIFKEIPRVSTCGYLVSMADEVLASALGGNFSSRLYQKLRHEKSLVYNIETSIDSYTCGNIFYILTRCRPKNIKDVVTCLCEEISKVRKFGISEAELGYAKNILKTGLLASLEDPEDLMFNYVENFLLGRFVPISAKLQELEKVDLSDVYTSAQRILTNAPTYGVIGNVDVLPSYPDVLAMLDIQNKPSSD